MDKLELQNLLNYLLEKTDKIVLESYKYTSLIEDKYGVRSEENNDSICLVMEIASSIKRFAKKHELSH